MPEQRLDPPPPPPRHRGHSLVAFLTVPIKPRGTGQRAHPVSEKVTQTRVIATGLPEQEDLRAPLSWKYAPHRVSHFNLHLQCQDITQRGGTELRPGRSLKSALVTRSLGTAGMQDAFIKRATEFFLSAQLA